jgi:DNA polymerase-3 subunit epsilon
MKGSRALYTATAAITLAVLAWAAAFAAAWWSQADAGLREALAALVGARAAIGVLFLALLPALIALAVWFWVARWPRAAARLAEQVGIVADSHAELPLQVDGPREMKSLSAAVARLALRRAELEREVDARIAQAQARLAEETQRLAALMSELPQGVLVCTADGRILLYNARAAELFDDEGEAGGVGLGRSVFGLIERAAIVHALEQAAQRGLDAQARPAAQLVTASRFGSAAAKLLRVHLALVREGPSAERDARGDAREAGFVLVVEDLTRSVDSDGRRDTLLHQLTEGQRGALGSLRSAAEALQRFPDMTLTQRTRFVQVIHDEAERLTRQLDDAVAQGADPLRSAWPREDMHGSDLLRAAQRGLQQALALEVTVLPVDGTPWLQLDSHAFVQAAAYLAGRVRDAAEVQHWHLSLRDRGRFAWFEIGWDGTAPDPALLTPWLAQPIALGGTAASVQQVLDRHAAECWLRTDLGAGRGALCVQLPTLRAAPPLRAAPTISRPIYYDFDLFHQPGQTAALDETALAALTFTVFDTETTGLSPSSGDEIVSIGAVRIVNGRLLEHEHFDRLVRPRKAVGEQALAVHGIGDEMLRGEPPIERVLPAFARFAADTVLVAHNAAFDMRFLELARERTGIAFTQPVLDTLLLSEAVHPAHGAHEHHLEQIASRLGVDVHGRHTALGDAIVTGEVLLKLLPLLAARGVHTLGQAREASARTSHARLRY